MKTSISISSELIADIDAANSRPVKAAVKSHHRKSNNAWYWLKKGEYSGQVFLDLDGHPNRREYIKDGDIGRRYKVLDIGPKPSQEQTKRDMDLLFQAWENED